MAKNVTDMVFALYGHDKTASKALKDVGKSADNTSDRFKKFGKVAATSLLAVGGAAVALAAQSVKNAIEDEKSQRRLAIALKNTVNATKEQTASVEDYISKTQARYGVVDDKLRPSFQRLVTATKDVTEAQKLQTLALDISAGTGKDLGTVSNALGKAYGGNLASLQRLGIGLDQSIIKSHDTNKAFSILSTTFGGQAAGAADSFEGKIARLKIAMDETKEQIGYALLPIIQKMADYILTNVVPQVQAFVDGLTGVSGKGDKAYESVKKWGTEVRSVIKWIADHKHIVIDLAAAMATFWAVGKIASAVSTITGAFKAINTIMKVTRGVAVSTAAAEAAASGGTMVAIQAIAAGAVFAAFGLSDMWGGMSMPSAGEQDVKTLKKIKAGDTSVDFSGYVATSSAADLANINNDPNAGITSTARTAVLVGSTTYYWDPKVKKWYVETFSGDDYSVQPAGVAAPTGRAVGGSVARGVSYMVGEHGPEMFTPSASGSITRTENLGRTGSGINVVVNVTGSVIHEKDLAVTVRDNIAQLMRRRGLNPAILGV